jgi:hypothetical protein
MRNTGLIQVLREGNEIKHGSMLDGDFNSDASKQSWTEFLLIWAASPALAIGRELYSWHGEVETKEYSRHFLNQKMQLPITYKVSLMGEGTNASDFLEGVSSDENGEYYAYDTGLGQRLNFYLPNSTFFKKNSNVPYKFETEEGHIYTLLLEMLSKKTALQLQLGSDLNEDDMTISLKNLNPDGGNGWSFSIPPNFDGYEYEYYRRISNQLIPFNLGIYSQSVKSSFVLWWEKWGVVVQIAASIVMAYFTAGLSAWIEGVFVALAEMEVLAGAVGVFSEVSIWVSATGAFNVSRATILAMFLLEASVNLPAAYIDLYFTDNEFACVLGIVFCFFPVISAYGKLGRFIKGSYSRPAVDSILNKILSSGINKNSSEKVLYDFIINLSSEQKLMFSEAMKILGTKEGSVALKESLEQAMKTAAKNKEVMVGFQKWLKVGWGSGFVKNLGFGVLFFGLTTGVYVALKVLMKEKNDTRSQDEVLNDAETSVKKYVDKFVEVDSSKVIITTSTTDIIENRIKSSSVDLAANYIYSLSNEKEINDEFLNYISEIKMNEAKNALTDLTLQGNKKRTIENIQEIINTLNIINDGLTNPIPEKEFFTWIENEETTTDVIDFLSTYSKETMSKQISEAVNKFKCLPKRFKYIEGYELIDNDWMLIFEVTKDIRIKFGADKTKLDLVTGERVYLRSDDSFTYKNTRYSGFSC